MHHFTPQQFIDKWRASTLKERSGSQSHFTDQERLKPGTTREAITQLAARESAELAQRLQGKGHDPQKVAHFINRMLFCMFAEDNAILPDQIFGKLLEAAAKDPSKFVPMAKGLFGAMRKGGAFGVAAIEWFNGGLFDDDDVFPLDKDELTQALRVSRLDWSDIEPSIFGTLFERGLDPVKRSQLGAHYTDRRSIMRIVEPVVLDPLRAEWELAKGAMTESLDRAETTKNRGMATKARNEAKALYENFLDRLATFRVLDPACGSGNFLYLALLGLKDLEHQVSIEAEVMGLQRAIPRVGPQCVMGIEINPYAAELARVTIWIGQIQWMLRHGFSYPRNPVLQAMDQIECRDALLNEDGTEADWPRADAIVGNPPFLGDKKMLAELGSRYATTLRKTYQGRVPGGADFVTYWFEKARAQIEGGKTERAGLVTTNSIRGGKNRHVLERICDFGHIYCAWSDEAWVLEGAAVRVSLVCFGSRSITAPRMLDGERVTAIHSDLTGSREREIRPTDLTRALSLSENSGVAFSGITKKGAFDLSARAAREMLSRTGNPNGRPNSGVLFPWKNGEAITGRDPDKWILHFGERTEQEAALYDAPFELVLAQVKPARIKSGSSAEKRCWWLLARRAPDMFAATTTLRRFIVTPEVSKHRVFTWLVPPNVPDKNLAVVAREDDVTFGILHSRVHQAWALRLGTSLAATPRYTHTTTFRTFPFPEGLTPNIPAAAYASDPRAIAIAGAAKRLNELRETWLNPPDLIQRVPEVVPGFPDRILPVNDDAAAELKKRTLTNLYNQKPQWLMHAHKALDEAVAAAYGWPADLSEDEILRRLLALNLQRAGVLEVTKAVPQAGDTPPPAKKRRSPALVHLKPQTINL